MAGQVDENGYEAFFTRTSHNSWRAMLRDRQIDIENADRDEHWQKRSTEAEGLISPLKLSSFSLPDVTSNFPLSGNNRDSASSVGVFHEPGDIYFPEHELKSADLEEDTDEKCELESCDAIASISYTGAEASGDGAMNDNLDATHKFKTDTDIAPLTMTPGVTVQNEGDIAQPLPDEELQVAHCVPWLKDNTPASSASPRRKKKRRRAERRDSKTSPTKCGDAYSFETAPESRNVYVSTSSMQDGSNEVLESSRGSPSPGAFYIDDPSITDREQIEVSHNSDQTAGHMHLDIRVPETEAVDTSSSQIGRHSSYFKAITCDDNSISFPEPSLKSPTSRDVNSRAYIEDDKHRRQRHRQASNSNVKRSVSVQDKKVRRRKSYRVATGFKPSNPAAISQSENVKEIPVSSSPLDVQTEIRHQDDSLPSTSKSLDEYIPLAESSPVENVSSNTCVSRTMEGFLNFKTTHIEGKKATDRVWRTVYAVLKQDELHLFAEKNAVIPESPISVKSCLVDIVYEYNNKKNVFRLTNHRRSAFLFEASEPNVMLEWIRAVKSHASTTTSDDEEMSELIKQMTVASRQSKPALAKKVSGDAKAKASSTRPSKQPEQQPATAAEVGAENTTAASAAVAVVPVDKKQHKETKTWKSKFAHKFRSPTTDSVDGVQYKGTFGLPLQKCVPSTSNEFVPMFVEVCTRIIEEKGLSNKGIYRVPGNTAAITSLQADVEKDPTGLKLDSAKWQDVNVVISLLKLFFRKLPESLITDSLYPSFLSAIQDQTSQRLPRIKHLLHQVPRHNFETFHHIARHLSTVASMETTNMMDVRNLAIIFGPTLLQPRDTNMIDMVRDMSGQCQIVECIIINHEWMFSEFDGVDVVDGKDEGNVVVPVTGMDRILMERAENIVAKEEKNSEIRKLLRRVTTRSKSSSRTKHRSKSAHGDIRAMYNERNIDEAVVAAGKSSAENISASENNQTLPETSTEKEAETRHRSGSLSRLTAQNTKESKAKETGARSQQQKTAAYSVQQISFRSPVTRPVRVPSERTRSRNAAGGQVIAQAIIISHRRQDARTSRATASQGLTSDSFLSREFVARHAGGMTAAYSAEQVTMRSNVVNSGQSYLGSAGASSRTKERPTTLLASGPYSPPRSLYLLGRKNPPAGTHSSTSRGIPSSHSQESFADSPPFCSPVLEDLPLPPIKKSASEMSFKKPSEYSLDFPPASPARESGVPSSVFAETAAVMESVARPVHFLSAKRSWNTKTCCWDDETVDSPVLSSQLLPDQNQQHYIAEDFDEPDGANWHPVRHLVFCRADVKNSPPIDTRHVRKKSETSASTDRNCGSTKTEQHSASSRDAGNFPGVELRPRKDLHAAENIDADICGHRLCDISAPLLRHSVAGESYELPPPLSRHRPPLYRALSCPAMVSDSLAPALPPRDVLSSPEHSVAMRKKLVAATDASSRRKSGTGRRRRINRLASQCVLPTPINSSWPGKGDIIGSMLTYESSV